MTSKHRFKLGLVWLTAVFAFACDVYAQDKSQLEDRLRHAIELNSIDNAQMKPWHLKLSFQLLGAKGAATEMGSIEEWWLAPGKRKTVYTSPSYTSTEIETPDGVYRKAGVSSPPALLKLVLREVVNAMPSEEEITQSTPYLIRRDFGSGKMDCLMLTQPIKNLSEPPFGLFPTYCFDQGQDALRISYDAAVQVTMRSKIGSFQGKFVAVDQSTMVGNATVITAHIEALQGGSVTEADVAPSAELEKVAKEPVPVEAKITAGLKISGDPPVYPASAKRSHTEGSVILHAHIGTDGRIHSLKIVSAPDGDLAIASMAAVRTWTYKPFLLNGDPVEVDTTITVNFRIG